MFCIEYRSPLGGRLNKFLTDPETTFENGEVRMYLITGHVILLRGSGRELFVFDSLPLKRHQKIHDDAADHLYLDTSENPVRDIVFPMESGASFLTIQRSGLVSDWQFDAVTREWRTQVLRGLDCGEGEVLSAVLHEGHRVLYWCWQDVAADMTLRCKVYAASLTTEDDMVTLGSSSVLLTDCPPCSLYQTNNLLIIWFKEPCPPGVFVTWRPANRTLSVRVCGHGVAASTRVYNQPANFHQLMLQTAAMWSDVLSICGWLVVGRYDRGVPHFISEDGDVYIIRPEEGELHHLCRLERWIELKDDIKQTVLHPAGILTTTGSSLWIHSLSTGGVLQTTPHEEHILGPCLSELDVQAGFVTPKGILQVSTKAEVSKISADVKDGCPWLEFLTDVRSDSETIPCVQSPALHLAAQHQSRDSLDLVSRKKLSDYTMGRRITHSTKLQMALEPLVAKFTELEHAQQLTFQNPKSDTSLSLEDELAELLPPGGDLCQHDVYFRVMSLAEQSPRAVTGVVLARTGIQPHDNIHCEDRLWTYLRSARGRNVLVVLTRLLYITQPDCLLAFLRGVLSSGGDDTPAFQHQTQAPLYREVLDNLPSHHQSNDPKMAVTVKAHIMFRSGSEGSEEKSMVLLIQNELWREAVSLLEELPSTSACYVSLYWMLVTAAAQAGSFHTYSDALLNLAPTDLSIVALLHQLKTAVSGPQSDNDDSTNTHTQDFPIGQLMQYLEKNDNLSP